MHLLIIFALFVGSPVQAFIGYDCGSRALNITTLSLLEVGTCDIPKNTLNITKQRIQLLQINDYIETSAISCKIEIRRKISYCGMHSHNSDVKYAYAEYIQEIGRRACGILHSSGFYTLGNVQTFSGIKINQTITFPAVFAGFVDNTGSCNGAAYADPYGSWDNVIVQGTIKFTVTEQQAQVKLDHNKIILRSGTSCKMNYGSCIDAEDGYTFWNILPKDACKFNRYTKLYEGPANKIIDSDENSGQTVYTLSSQDITFALASKSVETVCGYKVVTTEHPKLVIFEFKEGDTFAKGGNKGVTNLDIFAYVNSKFVYVERHIRTQIKQLYKDALMQRCRLERETIKNALAIATQAPDQFAYNIMKGPGYMAVTAGEVVHIVKCIPVEVKVQHGESCYAELQVTRENKTLFLTPRTHILKSKGTKITCNTLLPSHYLIDESWYKILPRPTEALTPTVIKPLSSPTWKYVSPASLATSGIYTEKDLDELRDHIMFPVERTAVLNNIAREIHGHPVADNEKMMAKLLDEETLEHIASSAWNRFWEKFIRFGSISAGIIAVLVILQGIKMLVEVFINGYILYRIYGWSLHMLGAIWTGVATLLMHLGAPDMRPTPTYVSAELEEIISKEGANSPAESTKPKPSPRQQEENATADNTNDNNRGFFSL